MKHTLKLAVPIVTLLAVIFGVTISSWYTEKRVEEEQKTKKVTSDQPPLRFFNSTRKWDPPSVAPEFRNFPLIAPSDDPSKIEAPYDYSMQDRIFPGFFEPSTELRRAPFWFENRNPNPVTMQLKDVSCFACSGARLASIPPDVTKQYLQRTALAALPIGPFNAFGVGLVDPAASFSQLEWKQSTFKDDRNATFKVPAANPNADSWSPQWGILELTFTVSKNPSVPLKAAFATQVDGTQQVGAAQFEIMFASAEPCESSRSSIDLGRFDPLSGDREFSFLVYSATRGTGSEFGDLATPQCVIQAPAGIAEPGKFVSITKIARIHDIELPEVVQELRRSERFSRVRAAYRVTGVVRPKIGDARLDIGLMERTLHLTVGESTITVPLTAMVRGPVWLANERSDIDLGLFASREKTVHSVQLVAEKAAMELAVVEQECKPKYFKYELVKNEVRGSQAYYTLKITVEAGRLFGATDRDSVVVIEVKGPTPQRIRIPVKGFGGSG